jgi:hypothetical protein
MRDINSKGKRTAKQAKTGMFLDSFFVSCREVYFLQEVAAIRFHDTRNRNVAFY